MNAEIRALLLKFFKAAVDEAQPAKCLPDFLPDRSEGKIVVIGAGKASAAMAAVADKYYVGDLSGLVVTQYGYSVECGNIDIIEAGHPLPDIAGQKAASKILEKVSGLSAEDLVLCFISGGSSALLTLPSEGITLDEKKRINELLIRSGATINEINIVRKHLSRVKGGRLARACVPARLVTLLISDVIGDDVSVIGSGPTAPDPSTCEDALAVVRKFNLILPDSAMQILNDKRDENPKPGDEIFKGNIIKTVANGAKSLEAAAKVAANLGVMPIILGDNIEGKAREIGKEMAKLALSKNYKKPCVLLSGGELTVSVTGAGEGGPNTEFLLSLALELKGAEGIFAIACDTDGIDGSGNNAGAIIGPDTLIRANSLGINIIDNLSQNDSFNFFKVLDDLVVTGPTYTNVNDFRAIVISNSQSL